MTLLIVGGTGTLGRQVAIKAIEQGHQVRCLVRNPLKATFLKEKGIELVRGNLCNRASIKAALEGVTAVIDAATTRITDTLRIKEVDWDGKVALIQEAIAAKVDRFIFFSILDAEKYPQVPLMEIKRCTELFLAQTNLNYTILRPCGFFQGLILGYAVPILEGQSVWVPGDSSAIAYMNTQDIAKFAIKALSLSGSERQTFPVVGTRAWKADEIIQLCAQLSSEEPKVIRPSLQILRIVRQVSRFFEWGQNTADRLAFAEVLATRAILDAPMEEVYDIFGIDPQNTETLENYFQEYFSRTLKKLKELDYQTSQDKKQSKRKLPYF